MQEAGKLNSRRLERETLGDWEAGSEQTRKGPLFLLYPVLIVFCFAVSVRFLKTAVKQTKCVVLMFLNVHFSGRMCITASCNHHHHLSLERFSSGQTETLHP